MLYEVITGLRGWRRWYLIFALTDETYSLLTLLEQRAPALRDRLQVRVAALNHLYWVLGCGLGAWLGTTLDLPTEGAEFALPALFMVLVVEQYRVLPRPPRRHPVADPQERQEEVV